MLIVTHAALHLQRFLGPGAGFNKTVHILHRLDREVFSNLTHIVPLNIDDMSLIFRGGYRGWGGGTFAPPLNLEFFVPIFRKASQ